MTPTRKAHGYEIVRIENIHTGQKEGPYKVDHARAYISEANKDETYLRLLDLNFEECIELTEKENRK